MLAILFGLPLLLVAPILLIGSQVYQGGIISVDVLEKGPDGSSVSARVPGAVVPVAMMFMPSQVRTEIQCEMGEEMDWAFDVARAAIRSIGSTRVSTGWRPAGFSVSFDESMSP